MLFSSLTFLFLFLPLVLILYFICKDKYKNYLLFIVSLLFYSWGEPKYVLLMLLSIVFNYFIAIFMSKRSKDKKVRKILLIISILFNIGLLLSFKYLNFFINNINSVFNINISLFSISLPIGISFYTFQILSYVIDVYKEEVEVQKNIFKLGMYISFFPQLIAGPIVRYSTIEKQIEYREHSLDKVCDGFRRFVIGFSKKIIIANNVAVIVDTIFNSKELLNYGWCIILFGILTYTIQIYYDFSGYSDMAIGLGKIFGFDFLENFDYPYISLSITEFWKRWHISLSSFFKDYLYIPLGGNRVGKIKLIRNILIVWICTGFWHGASWNFIIWGLYFAIIILLEKMFISKLLKKLPRIFRWVYTFSLILISWVIFRIEDLNILINLFYNLFSLKNMDYRLFFNENYTLINYIPHLLVGIIFMFPIYKSIEIKFKNSIVYNFVRDLILIIMLVFSVFYLISNSYNPFIYFRF